MQPPPGTPTDVIGMDMGEGVPSDDMHGTHEQLRDSLRLSLLRTTCPLPAAAAPPERGAPSTSRKAFLNAQLDDLAGSCISGKLCLLYTSPSPRD